MFMSDLPTADVNVVNHIISASMMRPEPFLLLFFLVPLFHCSNPDRCLSSLFCDQKGEEC